MNRRLYNTVASLGGKIVKGSSEFDAEVPDHLVVASPGGVSATYHDVGHGFYGGGYSFVDRVADNHHVHGDYGNMYAPGPSDNSLLYPPDPTDPQWWNEQDYQPVEPPDVEVKKENFSLPENSTATVETEETRPVDFAHLAIFVVLVLLLYLSFTYFGNGVDKILKMWNSDPSTLVVFGYSLGFAILVVLIGWLAKFSFQRLVRTA
jgi:hypothetical protein